MIVKIGIIGCGAVTELLYLKTIPNISDCKIAYLYDKDVQRAQYLASIINAEVTDIDTLRANSDVIIICTPPSSHHQLVKDSMIEGKIIVCEKPFVPYYEDAIELIQLAKEKKCKLYVAHFRRLFPSLVLAKKIASTIEWGPLKKINIVEGGRFIWQAKSDYFLKNKEGGVIADTGSHTIDSALYIAGLDTMIKGKDDVTIEQVIKDKSEPSHRVDAKFKIKDIEVNLKLSRHEVLANQIALIFENGEIIVPAFLASYVLIKTNKGRLIVNSSEKYTRLEEVFYHQYKNILAGKNDDIFNADRFAGLTLIIDKLNNIA